MTNHEYREPETVREAWGLECPKCGEDDRLNVTLPFEVAIYPTWSEVIDGDHLWDDDSAMSCCCGHSGIVREFGVESQRQ